MLRRTDKFDYWDLQNTSISSLGTVCCLKVGSFASNTKCQLFVNELPIARR